MARVKDTALDVLLSKYVGDRKSPNLAFVSLDGSCVAAFYENTHEAVKFARVYDKEAPNAEIVVEDNSGVVWENAKSLERH